MLVEPRSGGSQLVGHSVRLVGTDKERALLQTNAESYRCLMQRKYAVNN